MINQPKQNQLYIEQNNIGLNNIESNNEDKNIEKKNDDNKNTSKDMINQVSIFNSNLLIKDNYSKEYVNEIKKVFRKEKELLEYKNKTLQYSLDKIKLEFSDKINNITKELENIQNTNIININTLKEN